MMKKIRFYDYFFKSEVENKTMNFRFVTSPIEGKKEKVKLSLLSDINMPEMGGSICSKKSNKIYKC